MATLQEIEKKCALYATIRSELAAAVTALEDELTRVKRAQLPRIRKRVDLAKQERAELVALIDANLHLFERPRTRVLNGVKVGLAKQRGSIDFDDEAAVIERIKRLLPEDQQELLITRTEKVAKQVVYDLSAADLKRLGITVKDAGDAIVVKDASSDVDKLVSALLQENVAEEVESAS